MTFKRLENGRFLLWVQKETVVGFFLRFYDDTGYLVNSLSFRFIQGLKSIQKTFSIFPGYRKEHPARFEFSTSETIYINPVENSPKIEVETDDQNHKITFICKPSPDIKKLAFQLQERDGRPIRVAFDIDRIWWRIRSEKSDQDPVAWCASLLSKSKSAFSPTMGESLELRLPSSLVRQPIKIGFQKEKCA